MGAQDLLLTSQSLTKAYLETGIPVKSIAVRLRASREGGGLGQPCVEYMRHTRRFIPFVF